MLVALVFPAALFIFTLSDGHNYAFLSFVMVILAMVPFLMLYELKKPKAREWIPLAVMAAIAAVGRMAFALTPHFKPVSAIIIITAMVFGPEAGFLTGAVAALASNLLFGQGPWTPWQMFAWGLIGFLAGLLSKAGLLKKKWQLFLLGFSAAIFTASSSTSGPAWAFFMSSIGEAILRSAPRPSSRIPSTPFQRSSSFGF